MYVMGEIPFLCFGLKRSLESELPVVETELRGRERARVFRRIGCAPEQRVMM